VNAVPDELDCVQIENEQHGTITLKVVQDSASDALYLWYYGYSETEPAGVVIEESIIIILFEAFLHWLGNGNVTIIAEFHDKPPASLELILELPDPCADGHIFVPVSAVSSSMNLQSSTRVTITVTGKCTRESCNDTTILASAQVTLRQSGTQTVNVGGYTVTVVVNSNNRITDIFVGSPPPPPPSGGGQGGNNQGGNSQGGNNQR
jgi:hypothetical protein